MALLHNATLTPTKLEMLSTWLPSRSWFDGGGGIERVGSYRIDDPAGEVGLEGILVRAGDGSILHVPLTYRAAPLPGADESLVGTSEHSVLGTRWVYDGCGDPVWVTELVRTILEGKAQAEEMVDRGGRLERREPDVTVRGSGTGDVQFTVDGSVSSNDDGPTTVVRTGALELVVVRVLGTEVSVAHTLTGTWVDGGSATLAGVRDV